MEPLAKIFGNSTHLKLILLFYNNNGGYFNNITGLANALNKSHVTIRGVLSDLLDVGIVREMDIGKSRVIRINADNPYTEALFHFFDSVKSTEENKSIEEIIEERAKETAAGMGWDW